MKKGFGEASTPPIKLTWVSWPLLVITICLLLASGQAVFAQTGGALEEEVAIATAESSSAVTRDDGTRIYEGIFNGTTPEGCSLVSVRIRYFPETNIGRTDVKNYRVCKGKIVDQSESSPVKYGIPEGIEDFASGIARNAQKYGTASGDYQGFKVIGKAVRDVNKCNVEIKIMRGMELYGQTILNGCQ